MIGTPCYAYQSTSLLTKSMFEAGGKFALAGVQAMLETGNGDSLIPRARNRIVATFLEGDYTHLMWEDADVGSRTESAMRLLLSDFDVVAGVYPLKKFVWPKDGVIKESDIPARCFKYPFATIDGTLTPDQYGFAEVKEATTGFMCIKRDVFARMIYAYPDLYSRPEDVPEHRWPYFWDFFRAFLEPGTHRPLSEDYGFCHLWRAIGGKVFIDLNSKLDHGGFHIFRGDLKAHLQARKAVER